jgi:sarcosine oxidase, subunit beta
VDAAAVQSLAPGIAPECPGGVYCPIDGHAEANATVDAFATAARRAGATIEEGVGVRALVVEHGRVAGVTRTDGTTARADAVIVAAGTWSAALLADVGVRLAFETRGLQMLLTVPGPKRLAPVVGCFDRGLSLKQLDDGNYLIGGGWPARITDEGANRWQVLDESVRGSLAMASTVYPPLAGLALSRAWAGLEAFTPDGLPVIGPVPGVDRLFVAAGFSGHGFALSPVVGDVLARLALGLDPLAKLWDGLRFRFS